MRRFFRHFLMLATVAATLPAAAAPAFPDTRPYATDDELQRALQDIRDRHDVPGLAAAVFDNEAIRAFGIGESTPGGNAITADSRFRAGQVSVLFTGMALAALISDGSIPADAGLRELAPEIDVRNAWAEQRPVRVTDLLAHRAGLGRVHYRDVYRKTSGQPLLAGINSAYRALQLQYRPGERTQYSVVGPAIAAYVVEKAAGFPYEEVLARMFFEPLDLGARLGRDAGGEPGDAIGHTGDPARSIPAQPLNFVSTGDLWISARDRARVGQLLLERGRYGDRTVLAAEAVQRLESAPEDVAARVPSARQGVHAEAFNGFVFYTKTGALPGFLARMAYSPKLGSGYVVLLNHGGADAALAESEALLRGQLMEGIGPPPPVPVAKVTEPGVQALEGWYRNVAFESPPRSFYQSWLDLAHLGRCGEAWCFSEPGRTTLLQPFERFLLRETGHWYPGWEIGSSGAAVFLDHGYERWESVPAWQVYGSWALAAIVFGGILASVVLLPAWTVSLVRRRITDYHELVPRLLPLSAIAAFVAFQVLLFTTDYPALGVVSPATVAILVLSIAVPLQALLALAAAGAGMAWGLSWRTTLPAAGLALAAGIAAVAMAFSGLFAFQTWNY